MSAGADWFDGNREHLLAAVARVRGYLECYIAERQGERTEKTDEPAGDAGPTTAPPVTWAASAETGVAAPGSPPAGNSALERIADRFGLTAFERDVLLLAAGADLEGRFESLLASAQGSAPGHATFSLALAALPDAHWSAALPTAPLRRWRLIEVGDGASLMSSPLRIDEVVLHALVGAPHPDERLRGVVAPLAVDAMLPEGRSDSVDALASTWLAAGAHGPLPVLALHGADGELRRLTAVHLARTTGSRVLAMRADALPVTPGDRVDLLRLIERECALSNAVLLIEQTDGVERSSEHALEHALETLNAPLIVSGEHPPTLHTRALFPSEVARLDHGELHDAWRNALSDLAGDLNGTADLVAGQFRVGPAGIAAIRRVLEAEGASEQDGLERRLWRLCRAFARPRLEGLAERIEAAATWTDLVLPDTELDVLRSIALHVRHRVRVQQEWGFAERSGRGHGIAALFAGPSGTGKTMAAEVLSNELQLDLYRIDLSRVVSKYIGETEKNLRRVFDAAEGGSAILLFDEADALFGKRSEVKDSHDRYANIEVSYLLQRMEAYHGLAILTTNLASAIDQAFLRRLRFSVTFPFPDTGARAEIWRRIFPRAAPTEGLDAGRLARLTVAGGNIRNIALHAAYFAAGEDESVRMPHIVRAARLEYAKLDRPFSEAEFGGWL